MVCQALKQCLYRIDWLSGKAKSIIPLNIKKTDNDQKNKAVDRIENHHINSILVQNDDLAENLSNFSIDADYNFERKITERLYSCIAEFLFEKWNCKTFEVY